MHFLSYFVLDDMARQIKNIECFEIWRSASPDEKMNAVYQYILNNYGLEESPTFIRDSVKKTASFFSIKSSTYWRICHRQREIMNTKYKTWLNNYLSIETIVQQYYIGNNTVGTSSDMILPTRGRPRTSFTDLSKVSKKRRVLDLVQTRDTDGLEFAAKWSSNKTSDKEFLFIIAF